MKFLALMSFTLFCGLSSQAQAASSDAVSRAQGRTNPVSDRTPAARAAAQSSGATFVTTPKLSIQKGSSSSQTDRVIRAVSRNIAEGRLTGRAIPSGGRHIQSPTKIGQAASSNKRPAITPQIRSPFRSLSRAVPPTGVPIEAVKKDKLATPAEISTALNGPRLTTEQITMIAKNPAAYPDLAVMAVAQVQGETLASNAQPTSSKSNGYEESVIRSAAASEILSKMSKDTINYTHTITAVGAVAAGVASNDIGSAEKAARMGEQLANSVLNSKDIGSYSQNEVRFLIAARDSFKDFTTQKYDPNDIAAIAINTGAPPVVYKLPVTDANAYVVNQNLIMSKESDGTWAYLKTDKAGLARIEKAASEVGATLPCGTCTDTKTKTPNKSSSSKPTEKTYNESDGKGGIEKVKESDHSSKSSSSSSTSNITPSAPSLSWSPPSSGGNGLGTSMESGSTSNP